MRGKLEGRFVSQVTQCGFRLRHIGWKDKDIEIAKLALRNVAVQSLRQNWALIGKGLDSR